MTKVDVEKINVGIIKPQYPIGQVIYFPEHGRVIETKISGYEVRVIPQDSGLIGVVSNYHIPQMVSVRRGEESDLVICVRERDFYVDQHKATIASRFLAVQVDDEVWRLAIGDRTVTDENSPYSIENCGLPRCCANISEARDILSFCRRNSGLIAHNRDELSNLIEEHGFEYQRESPIGRIFQQLEIK
ncbi:MAG: hypothetical protein AABW48_05470 [Nanoarchaeota archaeon]